MEKYIKTILIWSVIPFIGFCLLYFSLMLFIPACDLLENPEPGSECTSCNSDQDCKDGMTCELFRGGSEWDRKCAKSSRSCCEGNRPGRCPGYY